MTPPAHCSSRVSGENYGHGVLTALDNRYGPDPRRDDIEAAWELSTGASYAGQFGLYWRALQELTKAQDLLRGANDQEAADLHARDTLVYVLLFFVDTVLAAKSPDVSWLVDAHAAATEAVETQRTLLVELQESELPYKDELVVDGHETLVFALANLASVALACGLVDEARICIRDAEIASSSVRPHTTEFFASVLDAAHRQLDP